MTARQRVLRRVIVWGVAAAGITAAFIPWRIGVAAGAWLGASAWRLLPSARRLAIENLTAAFPHLAEKDRAAIGRAAMINLGRSGMEMLMLSRRRRARIEEWCTIEDETRLRDALSGGRGVVFVTGHTGNWELLAALVARRGYPATVVATPVYDSRLDDLLIAARAAQGVETIRRGSSTAARQLLSALRRNAFLGMLIDQDTDVDGAFVSFFGRPAYTPTGAAALALRTGAAVVCGFLVREGSIRHRMIVQGPITLIRTGDHERDVIENTALFTGLIERHIRAFPDQWVWFHRRWKRRPATVPPNEPGVHTVDRKRDASDPQTAWASPG
jgi:KDO2-lipid IV(A) lauroyltransferase